MSNHNILWSLVVPKEFFSSLLGQVEMNNHDLSIASIR